MTTATGGSHTPRLAQARVSDAMHPGVLNCTPDTPLREAARMMAMHRVHCVVIPERQSLGSAPSFRVLTDRDVVAAALDDAAADGTVGQSTTTAAVTVSDGESLVTAARRMLEHNTAHLLVLSSASGRPAGVLSSLDIAGLLARADTGKERA
jgi:CBS domain-containing protein